MTAKAKPVMTRRCFLGGTATVLCAAPVFGLAACGGSERREDAGLPRDGGGDGGLDLGPWPIPEGTTLSPVQYAVLVAAMDVLVPGDESSPGATLAHAAWYLDQLLGAFRTDPPRIFAGGPYSGRHGGPDGFSDMQRLTRVEELRWRTYIEGSLGLPEREWNGPVTGLAERYATSLDTLDARAREIHGRGFAVLELRVRQGLLDRTDPAFVQLMYEHAVEGTYGDPVYGGNAAASGWRAIDYEGDRQPIGYTARQMMHPEEG